MIDHEEISINTKERLEVVDITRNIEDVVGKSDNKNGVVVVWEPHTTAAVAVNEHDHDLWIDILETLKGLITIEGPYRHNKRYIGVAGEQNAHAHILNCLIKPNLTIPLRDGKMLLGTWQSILFIELDGPRRRSVDVHLVGG